MFVGPVGAEPLPVPCTSAMFVPLESRSFIEMFDHDSYHDWLNYPTNHLQSERKDKKSSAGFEPRLRNKYLLCRGLSGSC